MAAFARAFSNSEWILRSVAGLSEVAETSSKDSVRESVLSTGYVAIKLDIEPGVETSVLPVSDDNETEWKEDIEDAWVCLELPPLLWLRSCMVLTVSGWPPSGLGRGG